ncbi:MAG: RidA family protein [Dehalococcoidia bacterium]|nr:RidA family protein [Dehalococcoidia bacterium]
MQRQNIAGGSTWEQTVGYSRAVRAGSMIFVAGTVGIDEAGAPAGDGGAYDQARQALRIIGRALEAAGGAPRDVVRTRTYVTDIGQWQEVARAHAEVFGEVRPATTMVEVARLIAPGFVVEIEADALLHG